MVKSVRKPPQHRASDVNGKDHLQERNWYFERRISLDTIVGLIGIALVLGGPIYFWSRAIESDNVQTRTRVTLLETISEQRAKFDLERDTANRDRQKEVSTKVDKVDEKITAYQAEISKQMTAMQVAIGLLSSKQR